MEFRPVEPAVKPKITYQVVRLRIIKLVALQEEVPPVVAQQTTAAHCDNTV